MLCKLHCIYRRASVRDLSVMFQNKSVGVIERHGKIWGCWESKQYYKIKILYICLYSLSPRFRWLKVNVPASVPTTTIYCSTCKNCISIVYVVENIYKCKNMIMFNILSLAMSRKGLAQEGFRLAKSGSKSSNQMVDISFCVNEGPGVMLCCLLRWVLQ